MLDVMNKLNTYMFYADTTLDTLTLYNNFISSNNIIISDISIVKVIIEQIDALKSFDKSIIKEIIH